MSKQDLSDHLLEILLRRLRKLHLPIPSRLVRKRNGRKR